MKPNKKWMKSVFVASLLSLVFLLSVIAFTPVTALAAAPGADEQQIIDLVNQTRQDAGLPALECDTTLANLAKIRAQDMVSNNYLHSISPTYGSVFDMLGQAGIKYRYAGENLARATSINAAFNSLMATGGHRSNVLNTNFERIGVGVMTQGYHKVVIQIFTGGQKTVVVSPPPSEPAPDASILDADEQVMLELVNQERAKAGLEALQSDNNLVKLARLKAQEMIAKGYFSHTSPTYGSPFEMMKAYGVQYSRAGENLVGAHAVQGAHIGLMNSPGNRINILNAGYTKVGIGIVSGGPYGKMFVQLFIKPATPIQNSPEDPKAPEEPALPRDPAQTEDSGYLEEPPQTEDPIQQEDPAQTGEPESEQDNIVLSADEQVMLELVNSERSKAGLKALQSDNNLVKLARLKAQDMIAKGYFSHTSPTYGSPFEMMKTYGVQYSYAGENLAGASSSPAAHTNLMNSPGHRANILNGNFTKVGIGVVSGGPYGKMFVQLFTG